MASAFKKDEIGDYIEADPGSDLDYSVTTWLEGLSFVSATWVITPNVAGSPYNESVNVAPVTIDGVQYAVGKVASAWIKGLTAGVEYLVEVKAVFTGNRKDERSFRIRCRNL